MLIEIEKDALYIDGKHFCECEIRQKTKDGKYNVILVERGGNFNPYIIGCDSILHGEDCINAGILLGEYIIDGASIGSRAKMAHIVSSISKVLESGGIVE